MAEWLEVNDKKVLTGGAFCEVSLLTRASDGARAILKRNVRKNQERVGNGDTAREGLFYASLPEQVVPCVPRVYLAEGDMTTGEKTLVLEALVGPEWVEAGLCFGGGNVMTWGKQELLRADVEPRLVALACFRCIARIHAAFWNSPPDHTWLRDQAGDLGGSAAVWAKYGGKEGLDERFVALVDASHDRSNWSAAENRTLVHGDFHPGNCFYHEADSKAKIADWEMVGTGNGPQDLAQFLISHMAPELRRQHEKELLDDYHAALDVQGYSREQLQRDYVAGGLSKWCVMFPFLTMFFQDPKQLQYFASQILEFAIDHQALESPKFLH